MNHKTTLGLLVTIITILALPISSAFAQDCPCQLENVVISVENMDNGAILSFTTEDAETLVTMLEMFEARDWNQIQERHFDATVLPEATDDGFTLTITSDAAEIVTQIQEFALQKAEGGGCGGDCPHAHGTVDGTLCPGCGELASECTCDHGEEATPPHGEGHSGCPHATEGGCNCGRHGSGEGE